MRGELPSSPAFASLRVIDTSEGIAGPFCTKILAALGAQVIKIERPGAGDPSRALGPFPDDIPHPEKGGLYLYLNMGKLGITLDWETPTGQELLLDLLRRADVLVESTAPGTLDRLRLGYDTLNKANPRLIVASVTPFGQTGPYRDFKATEIVLRALSGEMYLAGSPEGPPLMKGGMLAQYHGGLHAFIAITAALYARESLGTGQHIDISTVEAWASIAGMFLKSYTYRKKVPRRQGGTDAFPGGLRRCKDGWVLVSGRGGRRDWWPLFLRMLDRPELRDEKFSTPEGRTAHKAELEDIFNRWLMEHSKEEVYHKAQAVGMAAAYVCDAEDLLGSPQMRAHGFYQAVAHSQVKGVAFPSRPFTMSRVPWQNAPAPELGQHNKEVFCDMLGLSAQELAALRHQGIV